MATKNILLKILLATILAIPSPSFPQEEGEEELLRKATGYFFQKKFDMAESLFQQIIDKNPDNAQACAYLGDIFLIKKRYDGALDLYQKSVQINPEAGENYFRIGQIYYYRKDGKQAVDNFKKAIEVDTQLRFAYYHIGLTYLMILRDKGNTIANWETYLQVAPDDPQYDRIKRAIELLKDPNFVIPPPGSDMTIEEALMLGGVTIDKTTHRTTDKEAGHESKKTKQKLEDIYLDDDL
ncbi:MAG TPA: tetratricopeptide repeat protein [Spirochaetota bacterium]|nr:tetratricopeptide repeat protein [Spirochaetota bacterium]HPC40816.1 tetratricopeptide repeat protein [Spirochaetota bacterium]HPL18381.1 tetratricopeptide repeat protein [Spirochaetota bacterium]HQF07794.1 tetratricopeptide repeat protein [Spirochaetota bacterium]HQH96847.1 tetratricopeptide repeat protein [Spirochaetota bacterium]